MGFGIWDHEPLFLRLGLGFHCKEEPNTGFPILWTKNPFGEMILIKIRFGFKTFSITQLRQQYVYIVQNMRTENWSSSVLFVGHKIDSCKLLKIKRSEFHDV